MTLKIPLVDTADYRFPPEVEAAFGGRESTWQLITTWQNGAHAFSGGAQWAPPAFRRNGDGMVYLRGLMQAPANGLAFILPLGYRPPLNEMFGTTGAEAHAEVEVDSNGNVSVTGATSAWLSLSGVLFQAA